MENIISNVDTLLSKNYKLFSCIFIIIFTVSWILSFIAASRAIAAIDNPSKHVKKSNTLTGVYYGGGLYKTEIIDVFINRNDLESLIDLDTYYASFPNEDNIEKELIFEQMKLIYIRDVKIRRFNFSLYTTYIWVILGLMIYLFSLL